jgi:Tfp pilus assembly protein PilO
MKSLHRKHIIIVLITFLITAICVVGVVFFFQQMDLKAQKVLEANNRLISYEKNKKIYMEETAELKKITERTTTLEKYKVTLEQIPQLLSSLESIGNKNKVEFKIDAVNTPKKANVIEKLTIDFSARGTYANLLTFIQDLERQPYQIKYTNFSFREGVGVTAEPQWEFGGSIEILSF